MASQRLDAGSRMAGAPPMRDLASAAQLCRALGVVEAQGWDSPTGAAVLQYAQVRVVRRLVSLRGFSGHAIEEAVVTGMSVAWEVLDSPSVRQAARPWGVVWRAVDRALSAEILTQRFQCSRNRASRVAADAGLGDGVLFVDDPQQIEGAVTASGPPHGDPTGLGPLLDSLTSGMVDAGGTVGMPKPSLARPLVLPANLPRMAGPFSAGSPWRNDSVSHRGGSVERCWHCSGRRPSRASCAAWLSTAPGFSNRNPWLKPSAPQPCDAECHESVPAPRQSPRQLSQRVPPSLADAVLDLPIKPS